jgi:hypothetical protein
MTIELYNHTIEISLTTIIVLQVITTATTIIWFEALSMGERIKLKLGISPWEFTKPWDCRFCTHFWLGAIIALATLNPGLFVMNILISVVYDRILNQDHGPQNK